MPLPDGVPDPASSSSSLYGWCNRSRFRPGACFRIRVACRGFGRSPGDPVDALSRCVIVGAHNAQNALRPGCPRSGFARRRSQRRQDHPAPWQRRLSDADCRREVRALCLWRGCRLRGLPTACPAFSDNNQSRATKVDTVNRWNKEKRFLKAYVDGDNDMTVEMDIVPIGPVEPKALVRTISETWAMGLMYFAVSSH